MNRLIIVLFVIGAMAGTFAAQATRKVTNTDLEKYRAKRVAAEREYRENYARLGFPSPEDLERQNEKSRLELYALADKLRAERLERERIEAERRAAAAAAQAQTVYSELPAIGYSTAYPIGSGYYWGSDGIRHQYGRRRYVQRGYFAGGQFWPTPVRVRSGPMFRTVRPR